jgi:hypothetical protein
VRGENNQIMRTLPTRHMRSCKIPTGNLKEYRDRMSHSRSNQLRHLGKREHGPHARSLDSERNLAATKTFVEVNLNAVQLYH